MLLGHQKQPGTPLQSQHAPAPSSDESPLAHFQFRTIGQEPTLLKRLGNLDQQYRSPSPSSASSVEHSGDKTVLSSRPSLLEALGDDAKPSLWLTNAQKMPVLNGGEVTPQVSQSHNGGGSIHGSLAPSTHNHPLNSSSITSTGNGSSTSSDTRGISLVTTQMSGNLRNTPFDTRSLQESGNLAPSVDFFQLFARVDQEEAEWNEIRALRERYQEEHNELLLRHEETIRAAQREKEQATKAFYTVQTAFDKMESLRLREQERWTVERQRAKDAAEEAQRLMEEKKQVEAQRRADLAAAEETRMKTREAEILRAEAEEQQRKAKAEAEEERHDQEIEEKRKAAELRKAKKREAAVFKAQEEAQRKQAEEEKERCAQAAKKAEIKAMKEKFVVDEAIRIRADRDAELKARLEKEKNEAKAQPSPTSPSPPTASDKIIQAANEQSRSDPKPLIGPLQGSRLSDDVKVPTSLVSSSASDTSPDLTVTTSQTKAARPKSAGSDIATEPINGVREVPGSLKSKSSASAQVTRMDTVPVLPRGIRANQTTLTTPQPPTSNFQHRPELETPKHVDGIVKAETVTPVIPNLPSRLEKRPIVSTPTIVKREQSLDYEPLPRQGNASVPIVPTLPAHQPPTQAGPQVVQQPPRKVDTGKRQTRGKSNTKIARSAMDAGYSAPLGTKSTSTASNSSSIQLNATQSNQTSSADQSLAPVSSPRPVHVPANNISGHPESVVDSDPWINAPTAENTPSADELAQERRSGSAKSDRSTVRPVYDHYSPQPTGPTANTPLREYDHWSPTPGRVRTARYDRSSGPSRKRLRDSDIVRIAEDQPASRRQRLSPAENDATRCWRTASNPQIDVSRSPSPTHFTHQGRPASSAHHDSSNYLSYTLDTSNIDRSNGHPPLYDHAYVEPYDRFPQPDRRRVVPRSGHEANGHSGHSYPAYPVEHYAANETIIDGVHHITEREPQLSLLLRMSDGQPQRSVPPRAARGAVRGRQGSGSYSPPRAPLRPLRGGPSRARGGNSHMPRGGARQVPLENRITSDLEARLSGPEYPLGARISHR
ncbi:hypothetical protein AcV7_004389 [Taiwanofungus camphoratus]|nr:hypothetical protein AcV7_004389 [Antrodia cinnamomea]